MYLTMSYSFERLKKYTQRLEIGEEKNKVENDAIP